MLTYKEDDLVTFKDSLIKTYNNTSLPDVDIENEEEEILDHNFDFAIYNNFDTYEEKMRYIILNDQFKFTDIMQLKKVFINDFKNSIEEDTVNALKALTILLNYDIMKDTQFFIVIQIYLNQTIPTNNKVMKNIAKLIFHYHFQLPNEYLLALIDEMDDMNFKQKKDFMKLFYSYVSVCNSDSYVFLQKCFDYIKYLLIDLLEPFPYQILSIISILYETIDLPNDFIIEFFDKFKS